MSKNDPKIVDCKVLCQEDVQNAKASLSDLDVEDPSNGKEKLQGLLNENSERNE